MIDRKTASVLAGGLVVASLTLISTGAAAQTSPGNTPPGQSFSNPGPAPGTAAPSDRTVRAAGAALRDVVGIKQSYGPRMQSASPDQQQHLAQQAEQEEVAAVRRHGLSVDQFNQVVQTARADPQVRSRLLAAAGVSGPQQ
jgi:Domain of unknown function (DUF4168)